MSAKITVTVSKTIQEANYEPYSVSATVEVSCKSSSSKAIKKKYKEIEALLREEVRSSVLEAIEEDED